MESAKRTAYENTVLATILALFASGNTLAGDVGYLANLMKPTRPTYTQLPQMVREKGKTPVEETPPVEPTAAELEYMSSFDPFVNHHVAMVDPILKKRVDGILTGKAFKSNDTSYDYFRYVTFYNVEVRKERVEGVPAKREQCHNTFAMFSGVDFVETYTATVTATASFKSLGLTVSGSVSKAVQNRENFGATGGIIADHIPYFLKEDWFGRTFIETYDSKTRKFAFIVKEEFRQAFRPPSAYGFQSSVNTGSIKKERIYPMLFRVINKQWTFSPERKILGYCNTGLAPIAPPSDAVLMKNALR